MSAMDDISEQEPGIVNHETNQSMRLITLIGAEFGSIVSSVNRAVREGSRLMGGISDLLTPNPKRGQTINRHIPLYQTT